MLPLSRVRGGRGNEWKSKSAYRNFYLFSSNFEGEMGRGEVSVVITVKVFGEGVENSYRWVFSFFFFFCSLTLSIVQANAR